jgi:hypothetical protein
MSVSRIKNGLENVLQDYSSLVLKFRNSVTRNSGASRPELQVCRYYVSLPWRHGLTNSISDECSAPKL